MLRSMILSLCMLNFDALCAKLPYLGFQTQESMS